VGLDDPMGDGPETVETRTDMLPNVLREHRNRCRRMHVTEAARRHPGISGHAEGALCFRSAFDMSRRKEHIQGGLMFVYVCQLQTIRRQQTQRGGLVIELVIVH